NLKEKQFDKPTKTREAQVVFSLSDGSKKRYAAPVNSVGYIDQQIVLGYASSMAGEKGISRHDRTFFHNKTKTTFDDDTALIRLLQYDADAIEHPEPDHDVYVYELTIQKKPHHHHKKK